MRFHLYKMTRTGIYSLSLFVTATTIMVASQLSGGDALFRRVAVIAGFPVGWLVVLFPMPESLPRLESHIVATSIGGVFLALNCYFWGLCISSLCHRETRDNLPGWFVGSMIAVAWMLIPFGTAFWSRSLYGAERGVIVPLCALFLCLVVPIAAGAIHRSAGIAVIAFVIGMGTVTYILIG